MKCMMEKFGVSAVPAVIFNEKVSLVGAVPVERYRAMVTSRGGKIHRLEDWGRRQLAFQIKQVYKAHYVCLNIEIDDDPLAELEHAFKFNDAVLRHLIIQTEGAQTHPSPMMKEEKAKNLTHGPAQPVEAAAS